jgi:hypothetical protein
LCRVLPNKAFVRWLVLKPLFRTSKFARFDQMLIVSKPFAPSIRLAVIQVDQTPNELQGFRWGRIEIADLLCKRSRLTSGVNNYSDERMAHIAFGEIDVFPQNILPLIGPKTTRFDYRINVVNQALVKHPIFISETSSSHAAETATESVNSIAFLPPRKNLWAFR